MNLDADLLGLPIGKIIEEVIRLREGIRKDRDRSGHDLCWRREELWSLLPEAIPDAPSDVPPWPEFMEGCVAYRRSLDACSRKGAVEVPFRQDHWMAKKFCENNGDAFPGGIFIRSTLSREGGVVLEAPFSCDREKDQIIATFMKFGWRDHETRVRYDQP